MPQVFPIFVAILTFFTITEQYKSLKEIEQILKKLALQTIPKNNPKPIKYLQHYPKLEIQDRRGRYQNNREYEGAESQAFLNQLNNLKIQQDLEEDLQQTLRFDSDRICKATGRCGCHGARCGRPQRVEDRTVDGVEQLLKQLSKDLDEQHHQNYRIDEDLMTGINNYDDGTVKFSDQRQEYEDKQQNYESRQRQNDRNQDQNDRRQRNDDRKQSQQYHQRIQRYEVRGERQEDRKQQPDDRSLEYYDRREEHDDHRQHYDNKRQKKDDNRQEYSDRREIQDERRQQYKDRSQRQNYINADDDVYQNFEKATMNYKNSGLDIVILEVPDSNEYQIKDDVKVVDISESGISDLLQQRQMTYDNNDRKKYVSDVKRSLEDFVKYYENVKKDMTNGLLKYIKGLGDSSYLSQLFPYQKKQIENLKKLQFKTPLADNILKTKIIQLILGKLSNIKLLPHSKDVQTIYIPQRVHDALPSYNRKKTLRSNKRLFPLTFFQKQRKRQLVPKNIISKHAWRRNNQQVPEYGVPFDLQIQGLGQVN